MEPDEVKSLVVQASADHPLRASSARYVDGFSIAASRVYGQQCEKILQEKFSIPNDSAFKINPYLQYAAELSVQNHLIARGDVVDFEIDKQINPPKNVEAYFKLPPSCVALEVKCAEEPADGGVGLPNELKIQTAGRVDGFREKVQNLRNLFAAAPEPANLLHLKNNDNKLKQYLEDANAKFSPHCGINDLNVLFAACGDAADLMSWHGYLANTEGLFTSSSFHPTAKYNLVDVVVLSNLKYWHKLARDSHDWTLNNVFMVPVRNPFHRRTLFHETLMRGLSVFDHHMSAFVRFKPDAQPDVPPEVIQSVKMIHYIKAGLPEPDRQRYFPI